MNVLFWKALFAFLALPGVVAYLVPLALLDRETSTRTARAAGRFGVVAGTALLLWCVREFYVSGKGTLAPWTPPAHLVISGPYRFSRNPMYVAVAIVLCGWALVFRSREHAIYAVAVVVAFQLRLLFGEEPWLAHRHGGAWQRYRSRVPRWLGRRESGVRSRFSR
jgi:protein-S-isoprenylcysteine O-methyltransferase Ste14